MLSLQIMSPIIFQIIYFRLFILIVLGLGSTYKFKNTMLFSIYLKANNLLFISRLKIALNVLYINNLMFELNFFLI